jgi:hypothetical protein
MHVCRHLLPDQADALADAANALGRREDWKQVLDDDGRGIRQHGLVRACADDWGGGSVPTQVTPLVYAARRDKAHAIRGVHQISKPLRGHGVILGPLVSTCWGSHPKPPCINASNNPTHAAARLLRT